MGRRFVLSDIHGCIETFRHLVEGVIRLEKSDTLYLLGDYIDRGPDSKGVIDFIMNLQSEGYAVYPLKGNHEQMLLDALEDQPFSEKLWRRHGGETTLQSFGVTQPISIPSTYIQFFASLKHFIELEDFILVHAGLNFKSTSPFDDLKSMLWIREYEVNPFMIKNRIIIQGHTPTPLNEIEASIKNSTNTYRIFLDNGCVYRNEDNFGNLCCLNLSDMKLNYIPNIEL